MLPQDPTASNLDIITHIIDKGFSYDLQDCLLHITLPYPIELARPKDWIYVGISIGLSMRTFTYIVPPNDEMILKLNR